MEKKDIVQSDIPDKNHVVIYFSQKKMPAFVAQQFYDYYESVHWKSSKGNPVNWKKEATNWIWKEQERMKKLKRKYISIPVFPSSKKNRPGG